MIKHCLARWIVMGVLAVAVGCASSPQPAPSPAPAAPTSAQAGTTTIVAIAPPPAPATPPPSLIDFLGLPQIGKGVAKLGHKLCDVIRSRLGMRFPGLEPRPPVLPLTDPANFSEDAPPAVKAAAEIKAEQDEAQQKIKALRYLATIGCSTCYPDVENAFLAALDDCTEQVRYEALRAIRGASGAGCARCGGSSGGGCCTSKIIARLRDLAEGRDDQGTLKEPSERVRRLARRILDECGSAPEPLVPIEAIPSEGPEPATPPPSPEPAPSAAPPPPPPSEARSGQPSQVQLAHFTPQPHAVATGADNTLAATVNGEPIYWSDIMAHVERRLAELELEQVRSAEARQQLRALLIKDQTERAIDQKVIEHFMAQAVRRLPRPVATTQYASASGTADTDSSAYGAEDGENGHTPPTKTTRSAAWQWVHDSVQVDTHVSWEERLAYYRAHADEFVVPMEVRWERISALRSRFATRQQAYTTITYLRDRAMSDGAAGPPPEDFDPRKVETVVVEWTDQNQNLSRVFAQTLFGLPVGQLSPILEDQDGFHLVRVLERRAAKRHSPEEVSELIAERIVQERREQAEREFVRKLRDKSFIWRAPGSY